MAQLPPDEGGDAADKEEGEQADEARCKPIVLLAFIEHDLQAAHGEGEKAQAEVVDLPEAGAGGLDPRRVLYQPGDQEEGQNTDRNVDEEDPAPGEVVGDPAAERGSDGGREDGDQAIEGKCLAALLRLEAVGHDGLGHGLHSAAAGALQYAKDEQHGQRGSHAAKKAGDGKNHDAEHEKITPAHHARGPGADGQHDGVRDQVAGQHPGALIGGSAERAGDVGQGHVCDGGVQHLHERGQRHGGGDDPGIDPGFPDRAGAFLNHDGPGRCRGTGFSWRCGREIRQKYAP